MDKEADKFNLDDIFNYDMNEGEEEQTPSNVAEVDEILQKNIEERDKSNSNDKEYINKYNKDNLLSKDNIKKEKMIEDPDFVEQLLADSDKNKKEEKENEKNKNVNEQNKKYINIHTNKDTIKLPEIFENNPTPFDFIDYMERDYNKCMLEKDRDKYFYLEKCQKEGKYHEVKCWNFIHKNAIMNHILKKHKENYTPSKTKETKITCIVASGNLIYIGNDKGVIKIFSLNNEIEIGPLNFRPEEIFNIERKKGENNSVTSMDILDSKNLLACGYYNGIVEVWDLKNKKIRKKILPSVSNHNSPILVVKFLNGNAKMMELISSDCSGLVNIITLTEKIFTLAKNAEFNAEVNVLIKYSQPIFVVEMLKFNEEERKMPFLKKNIEIVGFACYDYVFIYQINPDLRELIKFEKPKYFTNNNIADISFGIGYIPRTKGIIDINRDQNQRLNEKASEYCIDTKNLNRIVAFSWDTIIYICAIKFDLENGVEQIAIVGNYINSSPIKRMFFVKESLLFVYDKKGTFKLLNTGMMTPGEIDENEIPSYDINKEKRALVQELTNMTNKVLKQNYIPQSINEEDEEKKEQIINEETYYNSIYSNNNNIYILGENELEFGEIYSWEECINILKNDSEWINALIFGLKSFRGDYITFSGIPIDAKKIKEKVSEKMRKIIKEYIEDRFKVDRGQINESKYSDILSSSVLLSIEFCFGIQSIDFLLNEILPIFSKKKMDHFFFENLEPYIIDGNIGDQIISEEVLKKIIVLFTEKKEFQKAGQIIKNLYLSVADSDIVENRTTQYFTIFTGLITYCSGEKNKDFMLPAREIYSYFQSAKNLQTELYWQVRDVDNKKYLYFDYEKVVNNTDIDDLILSYQYLGSLLLWYINLCIEGYKFPSGKPIDNKKYESLIQQLFLWLINDEVLQKLLEFDSYSLFSIFKKIFTQKLRIIEKIEYSDLFKLIKIGDKELQEASIQKYLEIIYRKVSRIDKDSNNTYITDDLYDFICYISTKIQFVKQQKKNLLDALFYVLNYEENNKKEEIIEQEVIGKKGKDCEKYTELKDKYDRYCMHLRRYKENNYILNLPNIIMASIENNNELFSNEDLESILRHSEKTNLTKVKIYLAQKLDNFGKCLDIYLREFKGEERKIMAFNFIYSEFSKVKNNENKYERYKDILLLRVTPISVLSIDELINLTDNIFEGNYSLILENIRDDKYKLKFLEEILYKYKEDEINPSDPVAKVYINILKLHIDLLCQLKYYDQILPNLKKRYFYPIDYCLNKCNEAKILDARIYLERKSGNIKKALRLVTELTKNEYIEFKDFLNEKIEEITALEESEMKKKKENNYDSIEEEEFIYNDDYDDYISDSEETKKNVEDNVLREKKKLNKKINTNLSVGIEICENASQTLSKVEAQENWSELLKKYYEIKNKFNSELEKETLKKEVADYLLNKLEENIGEIIEKMNSFFDLNSVLDILSQIKEKSIGIKEIKSYMQISLFSSQTYNHILRSAQSIVKGYVIDLKQPYKNIVLHGNHFDFEKCDFCGKTFSEKDKSPPLFFSCGHKYHNNCIIFINGEKACRFCKENEYMNEDTVFREDEEIQIADKSNEPSNKNRINLSHKSASSSNIAEKEKKAKDKKIKLLNEVNKKYFEVTKIFE